jgi:transcriptional regulator with XRE-family HTH domain
MDFGENLKKILKELKINQIDFAEKIGVQQSTVSGWVNNRSYPDFQTLLRITDTLNVDLNYLVYSKYPNLSNTSMVRDPPSDYGKNPNTEGGIKIDLIETERQLYERIIKTKDELIEYLKAEVERLKKGEK